MACEGCCYLSVQNTLNLLDPCVCNLPGGGTLVLSDGTVYIRTTVSPSCQASDFSNLGFGLNIKFVDQFGGTDNVSPGDTVNFVGNNGLITNISGNTLTISGNALFGSGAPTAVGDSTRTLNYVDTATGNAYFWNPGTLAWVGPIGGLTFINTSTISWSIPGVGLRSASIINNPTGGLRSVATGEEVFKDTVTNSNDNVLSTSANGTYVPPATRQLATATAGTTDESLPYKVIQLQAGVPVVVNHYHRPVARIKVLSKTGLFVTVTDNSAATQPFDNLTRTWSTVGGGIIATPTATSTIIQFPSQGEYQIFLTSVNEAGQNDIDYIYVKVDRILDVGGRSEENNTIFYSLQSAFTWINTNDPGTDLQYRINVLSRTSDAATITPNFAKVFFSERGRIDVGVTFSVAGTYVWTGVNGDDSLNRNIVSLAGGTMITVGAGVTLEFKGLSIEQINAGGTVIDCSNATSVLLDHCFIATGNNAIFGTNTILRIEYSRIISTAIAINVVQTQMFFYFNEFYSYSSTTILSLFCFGFIEQNTIHMEPSGVANGIALRINPHATNTLFVKNNSFTVHNDVPGVNNSIGIAVVGIGQAAFIFNNAVNGGEIGFIAAASNSNSFILINNTFVGNSFSVVASASLAGPIVPIAFASFPAYNNVFFGTVNALIGFIAATPIANVLSGNIQV